MKSLSLTELRRLKNQLEATARVCDGSTTASPWFCRCRCKNKLEHAFRVAEQAAGALTASTGDGRHGKGDHADPVFAAALPGLLGSSVDPSPLWHSELTRQAIALHTLLADFAALVHVVGHIDSTDPAEAKRSSGNCEACERIVPGTEHDKLRSGFCDACRKSWSRYMDGHPYPSRFEFVTWRRQQLAEKAEKAS